MPRRPMNEIEKQWQLNLRSVWERKKKELGLTQEKLAAKIGWRTQGAVTSYLNGRLPLNTDAKLKFAEALEVDVSEIDPDMTSRRLRKIETAGEFMELHQGDFDNMSDDELFKLAGILEQAARELQKKGG